MKCFSCAEARDVPKAQQWLSKMTKVGVFDNSDAVHDVTSRFTDIEVLRRARLHPLNILVAMHTYAQGNKL